MIPRLLCCIATLLAVTPASAQNSRAIVDMFGAMIGAGMMRNADAHWQNVPAEEKDCIDAALRKYGVKVRELIQLGIVPTAPDPRLREARQACSKATEQSVAQPSRGGPRYEVEGLALNGSVNKQSAAYAQYNCSSRDGFPERTWCVRTFKDREQRGTYTATHSLLHDESGKVSYVNRYQDPAYFGVGEIEATIERLSRKHGEEAQLTTFDKQAVVKRSVVAKWGRVTLNEIRSDEKQSIAQGRKYQGGLLLDLLGNTTRSAQLGLPIWRIGGGDGFVYVATQLENGRNVLRFFAADATQFAPISGTEIASSSVVVPESLPSNETAAVGVTEKVIRVALIIGNSDYRHEAPLDNPGNDARLLADTLRSSGFQEVNVKLNLNRQEMTDVLKEFRHVADSADWAVIYYSGHGLEMSGANYLIPVDAKLKDERDVTSETIKLDEVVNTVNGARRLRLVLVDACRNNPFGAKMRRIDGTRSARRGGLAAPAETEAGTLVVYAAKHGETAEDGSGKSNSPFMQSFVKRMQQKPALEVRRLFDYVRDDVLAMTRKRQQPFTYGSLSASEDFYFVR